MARIDIPRAGGLMPCWFHTAPQGGVKRLPVVVLHEGFGLNDHIESIAARLNRRGHPVIAPHLFWRQSRDAARYDDVPRALDLCANARADDIVADIAAAAEIVAPGNARVATLGFCFGGAASYIAAARVARVLCSVAYYPVSILTYWDSIGPPVAPLKVFFGTNDEFLGPKERAWLDGLNAASGIPIDMTIYDGANHAFFNDARPELFSAHAAAESWERTLAFFDAHEKGYAT